tara:strand:- start:375 stop:905 length:531 start_codon:yes stop_codon:yes gene_type:complete
MDKTTQPQLKVAIIGPESSGKTTLCKQLSDTLSCDWVPEFARKHLSENPIYIQVDLDYMLEQQLLSENNYKHPLLICDGDPFSFKVWSQYKFGSTSEYIEQMIIESNYDHFLLLQPDLPYENDPLRENRLLKDRKVLFALFENELNKHNLSYSIIDGLNKKRLIVALKALRQQKII